MKKISKVLIANRGEIALRIIRTCREMEIATVAVYSEVDRNLPHVLYADEAYPIGPAVASESYLDMKKLLNVAKKAGCDAVHPGYGFLAENDRFAKAVNDAGLIFIGPAPETIALMGSKTASREAMIANNVPVVPGAKGAVASVAEGLKTVKSIGGFPVLIKAAAGGGGKGMRTVHSEKEFARSFEAAKNEALKAFGDETVYIEKFVENPKHIEIQIIADSHGNVLHLWERDCSVQRRHQKVIEECPSAILTPAVRAKMGAVAIKAALACNYVNAGTVEFLFDEDQNFYFLEMNTRLQVEHPVTEMVMGLDLVRLQIDIAAGAKLPITQDDLAPQGHALECRLNAEDVFNNFVPATGQISMLRIPQGPGIRFDGGFEEGNEISPFYDPMFAKLIAHAPTRDQAIDKMKRALKELEIRGLKTTAPFCLAALDHPEFRSGKFTTRFIEQYWQEMQQEAGLEADITTVIAAAINHISRRKAVSGKNTETNQQVESLSPWKMRSLIK